MKTLSHYDVIINGGGMVGLSLAVALAGSGLRVGLIEKNALSGQLEPTFDGRVSAIALGSKRILSAIGAWEGMRQQAQPIFDIRVSDGDAPFFLHYDHRDVGEAPLGYIIENRYIRHALQETAQNLPNLTLFEKSTLEGCAFGDREVSLTIGEKEITCALLVGADGKHSSLRNMADIGAVEWEYKQTAIVCTIEHELPHHGLAQERFLHAGPFAVLPMTGNRSSLVWVEPNDRVGVYLELDEAEFVQEITERVGGYLGKISASGPRFSYPLSLMHAKRYIAPRLALIGDAAHAIHPIAGQGVNLGFRDVAVLSELIGERFARKEDIGSDEMLEHYQRWRRFDNVTMLTVTDSLNRLFSNDLAPIRLARGLGLWAVERMPPLKKFFMKQAMGLAGDIPQLMKETDKDAA